MILFDEIEKAHPDVWNVLLQVLDDGRLTDGQGRTVDFRNTVIVLTSNVGTTQAAMIEDSPDADDPEKRQRVIRAAVMDEVQRSFRPEFINRLDEIVVFHRLGREDLAKIVEIQLRGLVQRLARRDVTLELTPAARELLGELGWDPQYGARPLKRAIQKYVEDPLATQLLGGEFGPGDAVVVDRGPNSQLRIDRKMVN